MSIYGSLKTGVTGLKSQASSMAMISDNIANANTIGYKRSVADFETLVTQAGSSNAYSPGGVRANTVQLVDQQGLISASSSTTDIAIAGRGFFATANNVNTNGTVPLGTERLYTRAGSFSINNLGFLTSPGGEYLLGVQVAPNQDPATIGVQPANILTGINVGSITGSAKATSTLSLGANLPATAPTATAAPTLAANASGTNAASAIDAITTFTPAGSGYTTTVLIYDSLGVGHNVELAFNKSASNQWDIYVTRMTLAGRTESGSTPANLAIDSINSGGATATARTTNSFASPYQIGRVTFNTDGSLATTQANGTAFVPTVGAAAYPAAAAQGAAGLAATPVAGTLAFDAGAAGTGFNVATGASPLQFAMNLGTIGLKNGITQQSDGYAVSFQNQDGLKFGYRSGVAIDKDGVVRAVFDNGQRLAVAKIPLVTFADPNKLSARTGNVYAETDLSGAPTTNFAGIGGAGTIQSGAIEGSTVDLAEEFSNMIITQRNYSANSKTITTSDEMLQEIINLKR